MTIRIIFSSLFFAAVTLSKVASGNRSLEDVLPHCWEDHSWTRISLDCTRSTVNPKCAEKCTGVGLLFFAPTAAWTFSLVDAETCEHDALFIFYGISQTGTAYVYMPEEGNYCFGSSTLDDAALYSECQINEEGYNSDLTASQCPLYGLQDAGTQQDEIEEEIEEEEDSVQESETQITDIESVERQILQTSDGENVSRFGRTVSVSDDTLLVGARNVVYVFKRNMMTHTWEEIQKLTASDSDSNGFGGACAVEGDTAVIGSHKGAYIFIQGTDGLWTEKQKLVNEKGEGSYYFGDHVAIDNGTIVVGESRSENDNGIRTGSVFVYVRKNSGESSSSWEKQTQIFPQEGGDYDDFGQVADISGDFMVVGAPRGGGSNNPGYAVVYQKIGDDEWDTGFILIPTSDLVSDLSEFGNSVSISGDTIVVTTDDIVGRKAYVFERTGPGNVWTEVQKLEDTGFTVAIEENILVAHWALFLRRAEGEQWEKQAGLLTQPSGRGLTYSASISGATIAIGTPLSGDGYVAVYELVEGS